MKFLIPEKLETQRLKLRMFQESDWDDLHAMFSDEECVQYTVQETFEKWQTWRSLSGYLGHWQLRGYGPYAVEEKESGKMIGPVGLWYPGDWPEPEIKYSLSRAYWGKGYASEAARAVRDMAFQTMGRTRVISLIAPKNIRSISVAKKLGATFEKTIPFRLHEANIYAYRPENH